MKTLAGLHALLSAHDNPRLRHLAFMLLMRCGGLTTSLYREEEDYAPATAAGETEVPSLSMGFTDEVLLV